MGIGTWTANSALQIVGNVGIGSTAPNGALDVGTGSICLNHVCDTSWPSGGSGGWTLGASNVGISTTNNVGIGTTMVGGTGEAALSVMNGNVGIGTWVPAAGLDVETGGNTYFGGNVGIGSTAPQNGFIYSNCASHAGQAACWATNGAAGYCTTVVSSSGGCTCTAC